VAPGQTLFGENSHLPDEAVAMVGRIGPVTSATAIGRVGEAHVYRTDKVPTAETNRIGSVRSPHRPTVHSGRRVGQRHLAQPGHGSAWRILPVERQFAYFGISMRSSTMVLST
jgi:hypothetical protein